jgi:hypothetical protein
MAVSSGAGQWKGALRLLLAFEVLGAAAKVGIDYADTIQSTDRLGPKELIRLGQQGEFGIVVA